MNDVLRKVVEDTSNKKKLILYANICNGISGYRSNEIWRNSIGGNKKKIQLQMDEMRQERKKKEMQYALVIFASPVYFEIKFDYSNLLFKTKYNHE